MFSCSVECVLLLKACASCASSFTRYGVSFLINSLSLSLSLSQSVRMHVDVCRCSQSLRGHFDEKMHPNTHVPTAKMHGAPSTVGDPVDAAGFMEPLEALTGHSTGEDGRAPFASCTRQEAWSRRLNPFIHRYTNMHTNIHTCIHTCIHTRICTWKTRPVLRFSRPYTWINAMHAYMHVLRINETSTLCGLVGLF